MRTSAIICAVLLSVGLSYAADLALYSGHPNPGWYVEATMLKDVDKIKAGVSGNFKEVVDFNDKALDQLQAWAEANVDDGELDIIWLPGTMPSVLYPNPNQEPDGSLAERWLEGGNMFINVADWFAYCTYETGARGADNGAQGAENILNLPGIILFGDNTNINITDAGKKYLPSIGDSMITDRPIASGAVKAPWEIAETFGEAGANLDPVLIHNTDTDGYVMFLNQANTGHSIDRAQATIEFINNYVADVLGVLAVKPSGKLATMWGTLKQR